MPSGLCLSAELELPPLNTCSKPKAENLLHALGVTIISIYIIINENDVKK